MSYYENYTLEEFFTILHEKYSKLHISNNYQNINFGDNFLNGLTQELILLHYCRIFIIERVKLFVVETNDSTIKTLTLGIVKNKNQEILFYSHFKSFQRQTM